MKGGVSEHEKKAQRKVNSYYASVKKLVESNIDEEFDKLHIGKCCDGNDTRKDTNVKHCHVGCHIGSVKTSSTRSNDPPKGSVTAVHAMQYRVQTSSGFTAKALLWKKRPYVLLFFKIVPVNGHEGFESPPNLTTLCQIANAYVDMLRTRKTMESMQKQYPLPTLENCLDLNAWTTFIPDRLKKLKDVTSFEALRTDSRAYKKSKIGLCTGKTKPDGTNEKNGCDYFLYIKSNAGEAIENALDDYVFSERTSTDGKEGNSNKTTTTHFLLEDYLAMEKKAVDTAIINAQRIAYELSLACAGFFNLKTTCFSREAFDNDPSRNFPMVLGVPKIVQPYNLTLLSTHSDIVYSYNECFPVLRMLGKREAVTDGKNDEYVIGAGKRWVIIMGDGSFKYERTLRSLRFPSEPGIDYDMTFPEHHLEGSFENILLPFSSSVEKDKGSDFIFTDDWTILAWCR